MTMDAKGLLLVLVDPVPAIEEELNDWYDTEHLPERRAIPGFETARRFTCLGDGPRYAAIYDLASVAVLESDAYRAVSGDNFSPWTRRVTSRSHPVRMTAQQMRPGGGLTGPCARLAIVKFARSTARCIAEIEAGLVASFSSDPGLLQFRIFAGIEPAPDFVVAIAEFAGNHVPPLSVREFGAGGKRIELAATYRPYRG
jgi:hypothetical protein